MKILDKIVEDKKIELKDLSSKIPVTLLEKRSLFSRQCISLKNSILNSPSGIICEFKRKSPSNNNINYETNIIDVVEGYQNAGAVGVSILTNKKYFDGDINDIIETRDISDIPILRKEFIVSEYQVIEAKSIGSDAILLIASILESEEISKLSSLAKSLGLEVLVEIHSFDELKRDGMYVNKLNFMKYKNISGKFNADTKIRYNDKGNPSIIEHVDDTIKVYFGNGVSAITPGQAAVFYEGDDVIGGGWIKSSFDKNSKIVNKIINHE